jgi:hypothetical protein
MVWKMGRDVLILLFLGRVESYLKSFLDKSCPKPKIFFHIFCGRVWAGFKVGLGLGSSLEFLGHPSPNSTMILQQIVLTSKSLEIMGLRPILLTTFLV